MLNLRGYKCPQQFVQFKLGLRRAKSLQQNVTFSFNVNEGINDIERFLTKNAYCYYVDKQNEVLLV